jgi:hypothetical protein
MSKSQNPNQPQQPQPQQDIAVADPDNFARTRQLRSIFDARQNFIETRRNARALMQKEEIKKPKKNDRIYRALQDFIVLIQPVFLQDPAGRQLLEEEKIIVSGCCRPSELPELDAAVADGNERLARRAKLGQKKDVFSGPGLCFNGAASIINSEKRVVYLTSTEPMKCLPRERFSFRVFGRIQKIMSDVGLGVDTSEEQQTKITDDLLKEVDEWRRQNVQ